jgi:HNH endonuclease
MNLPEQETRPDCHDTRLICLTRGMVAKISFQDLEKISRYRWHAKYNKTTDSYYAYRNESRLGKNHQACISMAREICGLMDGDKRQPDHVNHDTLDNRRGNLRIATRAQNNSNRRRYSSNTSGHKGISWNPEIRKWMAWFQFEGKRQYLGSFAVLSDAVERYKSAAGRLHGEFACID